MNEKAKITHIGEMLRYIERNYSNPKAINYLEKGVWKLSSTQELLDAVKYASLGLSSLGVTKGDRIALFSHPSPRWTIVDLAVLALGAVTVPLLTRISDINLLFELDQTNPKYIFVGGLKQWERILKLNHFDDELIALETPPEDMPIQNFDAIIALGKSISEKNPNDFDDFLNTRTKDELATIVYTLDKSGLPKGVELTHQSLMCLIHGGSFDLDRYKDRYLSFLPLGHIFARIMNYIVIGEGLSIYYINSPKYLIQACKTVKPTLLVVVPRVLEKVYSQLKVVTKRYSKPKASFFRWAIKNAISKKQNWLAKSFKIFTDYIVYRPIRDYFGGKLRVIISGGAKLKPVLGTFYVHIGIPVYEGWGLTEAPAVTVNRPGKNKIGTVGFSIMPNVTIKLNQDNELLVKGPIVMRRYFNNPKETKQVLDKEGWLHTGDLGEIDERGFVRLVGRKKQLMKTAGGEYVAPIPIESTLNDSKFIKRSIVVAEGRKYASCLLFPDENEIIQLKKLHGMENIPDSEFLSSELIKNHVGDLFKELNTKLNSWERVVTYRFILPKQNVLEMTREDIYHEFSEVISKIYRE